MENPVGWETDGLAGKGESGDAGGMLLPEEPGTVVPPAVTVIPAAR